MIVDAPRIGYQNGADAQLQVRIGSCQFGLGSRSFCPKDARLGQPHIDRHSVAFYFLSGYVSGRSLYVIEYKALICRCRRWRAGLG
jgi:hypothetical protein